ncbi:MAG TPA: ABC transporter permease [Vicinamibacterales bacterium]|nr:ABC transporter permease [Vicinamibacterales bacterium]
MLFQDIRYGIRTLLGNPGFTITAILCLALGIGLNGSIFSVVDGVLLKPFPYPDADRIVVLNSVNQRAGINRAGLSWLDLRDIGDQNTTLAAAAGFTQRTLSIADGRSEPERYNGAAVSSGLFNLLGTPPAIGRDFRPDDDRTGAEGVVMLSDEVWTLRYNGDPSIVGRSISINGFPHTIIGVMPPGFMFPETQRLWVTLAPYYDYTPRDVRPLQVFARLKPGVSLEQASADLNGIAARLAAAYPKENENWSAALRPLRDWMIPDEAALTIIAMMGAVTLVLMIACSNVANLLLARASVRHREISIRAALGAGRLRIIRQLLTEAMLIGLLSAPLGVLLAWAGLTLINLGIPPDSLPYFIHWSLDARAVAYTIAISLATGLVFGLAPALQATRSNLQDSLKEGARGSTGGRRARLRNGLVVAEIAMSLVLLIGASLFVRSFLNLQNASVGFNTLPLLTMRFYLPGVVYEPSDAKNQRVRDIVRRVEALPGVEAAFASNFVPLGAGGGGGTVIVEGKTVPRGEEPGITLIGATPRLRQTLNVALVSGRDLTETEETTRTPVALVNQTMAKQLWPGQDAIGGRFRLAGDLPDWFTVVGVVADFRHGQGTSNRPVYPSAYVPYSFAPALNNGLIVRVNGDPARIASAVREQIRLSDASLPVFQVRTMEELRQFSFWRYRLFGWMFSVFGAVALLLASIGVYGVLSYAVTQRRQEIGVRVALGADRRDVLTLIVGHGLRLAAIGIVVGIVGAFGVTRFVKTLLYNVTPSDPFSFGVVAAFLTIVAAVASYVPARRAMAVDPIVALRNE